MPIAFVFNIIAVPWMLLLPLSITIAVIRYRLWDINPVINRTLIYGALSFLTIAFYILVVGGFALFFRSNETNVVISFIATGGVAILFEPLRQRLQRAVNRFMYGERDDPATVLMQLSQRLDAALAPDSVCRRLSRPWRRPCGFPTLLFLFRMTLGRLASPLAMTCLRPISFIWLLPIKQHASDS